MLAKGESYLTLYDFTTGEKLREEHWPVGQGLTSSRFLEQGRYLALVTRAKCALHGGREFLVHPLELLGRIGAEMIARLREVAPKL